MARVVVTDDSGDRVVMDEQVQKVHLETSHSTMQVIERLVWAVEDAEGAGEPETATDRRPPPRLRAA